VANASTDQRGNGLTPELLGMVGRLAGDYCPNLASTDVVDVARAAFTQRGGQPIHQVETSARETLDQKQENTVGLQPKEEPAHDH